MTSATASSPKATRRLDAATASPAAWTASNRCSAHKQKKWTGLVCKAFMRGVMSAAASLRDVERGLSWYMRARVRSVPCPAALAVDVDEVSDVAFVHNVRRNLLQAA
jgi:folate-dependent tRNA-U54 methylase TrmFO/GidA